MKNFKQFVKEIWEKDISITYYSTPGPVSIFKNPGSSDLLELKKSNLENGAIRFLALAKGSRLYCWNAIKATHSDVIDELSKEGIIESDSYNRIDKCIPGVAQLAGSRLRFAEMAEREYHADRNPVMDPYVVEKILANESVPKRFLYAPFTTVQELRDAAPSMLSKFQFIDKYVDGYMEASIWSKIVNQAKS